MKILYSMKYSRKYSCVMENNKLVGNLWWQGQCSIAIKVKDDPFMQRIQIKEWKSCCMARSNLTGTAISLLSNDKMFPSNAETSWQNYCQGECTWALT